MLEAGLQDGGSGPGRSIGGRARLLADLDGVCADGAAASLLILVELLGLPHPAGVYGTADDQVVAFVETRLAGVLGGPTGYYRLREPEFCVLVEDRPVAERSRLLRALTAALAGSVDGYEVESVFGMVRLPAETTDPKAALLLADERLNHEKAERGVETYAPLELESYAAGDTLGLPVRSL